MKAIIILTVFSLLSGALYAQHVSPSVVSTSGASMSQAGNKIHFIIGEITVKTIGNASGSIGQGFTSSSVASKEDVTAVQEKDDLVQVRVYPNPSSELLLVDIDAKNSVIVQLSVTDMNGKVISSQSYSATNNHVAINVKNWSNGVYFLSLTDKDGNILRKFKVVKE